MDGAQTLGTVDDSPTQESQTSSNAMAEKDESNEDPTPNLPGNKARISDEEKPSQLNSPSQLDVDSHAASSAKESNENEATKTKDLAGTAKDQVLTIPREYSLVTVTLTAFIQLTTIISLIVIIPVEIWVRNLGVLSIKTHSFYVAGITIMATLIAKFTTSSLKTLWVVKAADADQNNVAYTKRQQQLDVLFGLGSLRDQLVQFPVSLSFILSGLITAAVVAGLTLSSTPTSIIALAYVFQDDQSQPGIMSVGCLSFSDNTTQGWIGWSLSNGSILTIDPPACSEQADLNNALSDFSFALFDPNPIEQVAYRLNGVQVTKSAMGAPWSSGFGTSFGLHGAYNSFQISETDPNFESALQCFPVLSLNPVQCRKAGEVQIGEKSLHVNTSDCNVSTPIYGVDPRTQGATTAGICSDLSAFGRATILLGATNSHAMTLAGAMWDLSFNPPANSSSSYAVACDVDIAPQIAARTLIYDKLSVSLSPINLCSGVDTERMINIATNDSTLLYGMAGLYPFLVENTYLDGSLDLLWSQVNQITGGGETGINSTTNLLFTNSKTPLEDSLGLPIGIALGLHWGGDTRFGFPSDVNAVTRGQIRFLRVRVGNGRWESVLFIIPSLYSLALLAYLLWHVRRKQAQLNSLMLQ